MGIAISSFLAVGLSRLMTVIRQEQVQGTLEALLLTPTAWSTIEVGSAFYDILYVPVRTAVFLSLTAVLFDANYHLDGVGPAALVLLAFIPFVWGLGVISAASTLTFRRGAGGVGFLVSIATLGSGAYFPLTVLPDVGAADRGVQPDRHRGDGDAGSPARRVRLGGRLAVGRAADPDVGPGDDPGGRSRSGRPSRGSDAGGRSGSTERGRSRRLAVGCPRSPPAGGRSARPPSCRRT